MNGVGSLEDGELIKYGCVSCEPCRGEDGYKAPLTCFFCGKAGNIRPLDVVVEVFGVTPRQRDTRHKVLGWCGCTCQCICNERVPSIPVDEYDIAGWPLFLVDNGGQPLGDVFDDAGKLIVGMCSLCAIPEETTERVMVPGFPDVEEMAGKLKVYVKRPTGPIVKF